MKKILSIICLACLFSACSSDDSPVKTATSIVEGPGFSDPCSQVKIEEINNFSGIQEIQRNVEGLKIDGCYNPIGSNCQIDTGTVFIHGRIDGKLWVGCYDVANKTQYLDWTESEKLDTVAIHYKGYGEYDTIKIKKFRLEDVHVYENYDSYCFILNSSGFGSAPYPSYYTNLYFITDGILSKKHTRKYPEMCFSKIRSWYDGVLILLGGGSQTICYTLTGDSLFTATEDFGIWEEGRGYFFPINREEAIIFSYYGTISIDIENNFHHTFHFNRVNIKTGESVWGNEVIVSKQLPDRAKINFKEIKKADAIWEFICDYILYDGTKGTFHILLNIDTGHYELK